MFRSLAKAEARLARQSRRRLGLFTPQDAEDCGFSRATVWRRRRDGIWRELQDGVLAHPASADTPKQRLLAAVIAAGPDAVASHSSAAALWQLGGATLESPFHVTVPTESKRQLREAVLHCSNVLRRVDRVKFECIPVTAVPFTIIDNAGVWQTAEVEDVLIEAIRRRLATAKRLWECLDLKPTAPGTGTVRRVLRQLDPEQARQLMSRIETIFLVRVVRAYGLPEPEVNRRLRDAGGFIIARVDFSWPGAAMIVEIDGLRFHSTASQKRYDDDRQNQLVLTGQRVLRYGVRALDDPAAVAAEVRTALGQPSLPFQP